MALWGCGPTERYEQDKTWLILGIGIRMATDLNLHRKTTASRANTAEGQARDKEVHNRERTWLCVPPHYGLGDIDTARVGCASFWIAA